MTYEYNTRRVRLRKWSRRSFIHAAGAGIAVSVLGDVFPERAAANQLPEGLLQARQRLRGVQASANLPRPQLLNSTLEPTLAHLNERRKLYPKDVPGQVTRGGLTFYRNLELRRIALAEDLIRRTDPGPFENPKYLASLAYQAASLELAYPNSVDVQWSKFLIGTLRSPRLDAEVYLARKFPTSEDYTFVVLYTALIDFTFEMAKVLMTALNPTRSTVPGTSVNFPFTEQYINELGRNQKVVQRLYDLLAGYFFDLGYPPRFDEESVPADQIMPLNLLIDMAERWIIAHEYGHGFAARNGFAPRAHENEHPKRAEEYFADANATILTVFSAARLESVGPALSLAGPAFVLACLEVFRQGLSVVRLGKVPIDNGDDVHPPNRMRVQNVVAAFEYYIEDNSQNVRTLDLTLVHRPPDWKPIDSESNKEFRATVMRWSNALFAIWNGVRPRLQEDFENKRALHRTWK